MQDSKQNNNGQSLDFYKKKIPSLKDQGVPAQLLDKNAPVIRYKVDAIKRRRRNRKHSEWIQSRKARNQKKLAKFLENKPKHVPFTWPEEIIRESRRQETEQRRATKIRMIRKSLTVNEKILDKTIFVLRIRGIEGLTPLIKQKLRDLGLRKKHTGVFLKYTSKIAYLLRLVEPWITYGVLSVKNTRDLIMKNAYVLTTDGQKKPIEDNNIIEQHLGSYNIICCEDMIQQILTCGSHFAKVNNFMAAFRFRPKRYNTKKEYKQGGDFGWRGKKINYLIEQLL